MSSGAQHRHGCVDDSSTGNSDGLSEKELLKHTVIRLIQDMSSSSIASGSATSTSTHNTTASHDVDTNSNTTTTNNVMNNRNPLTLPLQWYLQGLQGVECAEQLYFFRGMYRGKLTYVEPPPPPPSSSDSHANSTLNSLHSAAKEPSSAAVSPAQAAVAGATQAEIGQSPGGPQQQQQQKQQHHHQHLQFEAPDRLYKENTTNTSRSLATASPSRDGLHPHQGGGQRGGGGVVGGGSGHTVTTAKINRKIGQQIVKEFFQRYSTPYASVEPCAIFLRYHHQSSDDDDSSSGGGSNHGGDSPAGRVETHYITAAGLGDFVSQLLKQPSPPSSSSLRTNLNRRSNSNMGSSRRGLSGVLLRYPRPRDGFHHIIRAIYVPFMIRTEMQRALLPLGGGGGGGGGDGEQRKTDQNSQNRNSCGEEDSSSSSLQQRLLTRPTGVEQSLNRAVQKAVCRLVDATEKLQRRNKNNSSNNGNNSSRTVNGKAGGSCFRLVVVVVLLLPPLARLPFAPAPEI